MTIPVLVRHDPGCRYARPEHGGHSDAAKRIADHYNLHVAAGALNGWWLAFKLADGGHDGEAYQTKAEAVRHQHHDEWYCTFVMIDRRGQMTVCQAESLLYMGRQQQRLKLPDRDDRRGGMDVIPRLTQEDHWRQMEALRTGRDLIGLGYRR